MISRPDADFIARLQHARKVFHVGVAQLAKELCITPEWLSKLLNGHHPVSFNIGLRFEAFLRKRGVDPDTFGRNGAQDGHDGASERARLLRTTIAAHQKTLLAEAGDDAERLIWLAESLSQLIKCQAATDGATTCAPTKKSKRSATPARNEPGPHVNAAAMTPAAENESASVIVFQPNPSVKRDRTAILRDRYFAKVDAR